MKEIPYTIEEGRRLLFCIFPKYPDVSVRMPTPPKETWHDLPPILGR